MVVSGPIWAPTQIPDNLAHQGLREEITCIFYLYWDLNMRPHGPPPILLTTRPQPWVLNHSKYLKLQKG